jgi:AcrR family transcriptional regulator
MIVSIKKITRRDALSPRTYRMGRRAASVEETRGRIRAAALAEYADAGIAGASMQAIARRADLASGTVLYHYPNPDELAADVIARRIEEVDVPTVEDVRVDTPVRERIDWLTREMFRVYAATDLEYQTWTRSRDHPVMRRYERWYNDVYAAVLAAALGAGHSSPRDFQVVSAVIDPGFRASLLARGIPEEEAAKTAAHLAAGWLGE